MDYFIYLCQRNNNQKTITMKKALELDLLRADGMDLLEKYSDKLDSDHTLTLIGLLEVEKDLTIESETFGEDVAYDLNLIIEILTSYEHIMSKEDQELFDDICTKSLQLAELSKYNKGQMIVYDNLPYMVHKVDFEDLAILLGDGNDAVFWVEVDELIQK